MINYDEETKVVLGRRWKRADKPTLKSISTNSNKSKKQCSK